MFTNVSCVARETQYIFCLLCFRQHNGCSSILYLAQRYRLRSKNRLALNSKLENQFLLPLDPVQIMFISEIPVEFHLSLVSGKPSYSYSVQLFTSFWRAALRFTALPYFAEAKSTPLTRNDNMRSHSFGSQRLVYGGTGHTCPVHEHCDLQCSPLWWTKVHVRSVEYLCNASRQLRQNRLSHMNEILVRVLTINVRCELS